MLQRKDWLKLWVKIFIIFSLQVLSIICKPVKADSNTDLFTVVKKNVEHLKRLDNKTDMIYSRLDDLLSKMDQVVKQNTKEEERIHNNEKATNEIARKIDETAEAVKNVTEDIVEVKNVLTGGKYL